LTHLNVKPADLRTHAGTVNHLADRVGNCATTGAQTNLGINTFGVLGQPFAWAIRALCVDDASHALKQAQERVHGVGTELAADANDLEATEDDIAKSFGGI
jgi:hypothetical protein